MALYEKYLNHDISIDRFSGEPPRTKIDLWCNLCGRPVYSNERRYRDTTTNTRICTDCYNGNPHMEEEYTEDCE
jgi:hypothetical protein